MFGLVVGGYTCTRWHGEVNKPDIYGMIPGVLDVNAYKDVLSPAAVSDSLLMTFFSFPFTLHGFLCAHQKMHDAQTGG